MAHEFIMGNDGIARVKFFDVIDRISIEFFTNDLSPFINATTPEYPLKLIMDMEEVTDYTSKARRLISSTIRDERMGSVYITGATRKTKVFFEMLQKLAPEKDFQFFENNEQATQNMFAPNPQEE